jgi:hypothetical protein
LVERRGSVIDLGIDALAATLDDVIADGQRGTPLWSAEDTCAAVMRNLVGNAPAQDDIAVLVLSRREG